MIDRRPARRALVALALTLAVAPPKAFAFVESTRTDGEIPGNLNGVWLVVSHLQFANPSPTPATTPAPGAGEAAPPAAEASQSVRVFNVANLVRITHVAKAEAQVAREREAKMQQAAVDKAKAIIAEEQKKAIPMQTETGEVEGGPKVLVPIIPPKVLPGDGDDVDIFLLDVTLPKGIDDSMQNATKAEQPWVPTPKDLQLLGSSWNKLPQTPPPGEYAKIEWKVVAADKYEEGLKEDPATKDAKFTIMGNQDLVPKPGLAKTNIVIFGARDIGPDKIEGGHARAMMAGAPLPLPIEMKGTFSMYKVAELPKEAEAKAPAAKEAAKKAPAKKAK